MPPRPARGQVLLRPDLVGICGSDLLAHCEGKNRGCGFGHEWTGEIVAIGPDVTDFAVGERATSGAFIGCGACEACRDGCANHCAHRRCSRSPLGAAPLVLPADELVRVPEGMGDAGILLEPASVAVEVMRLLGRIGAHDPEVLVVGAGSIGLLTALLLQDAGARVTAVDRCEERLGAARELGARTCTAGRPDSNAWRAASARWSTAPRPRRQPRRADWPPRRASRRPLVVVARSGRRVRDVDRYAGLAVHLLAAHRAARWRDGRRHDNSLRLPPGAVRDESRRDLDRRSPTRRHGRVARSASTRVTHSPVCQKR